MFDNEKYEIDTDKPPNILNPKQIELIANILNIPNMIKGIETE